MKEFESKNGQLIKMKHMGQLWLAAEVRALESRVKGKASYSPYLVLDADALIKQTFMVKHLVNSRKFIIIVPSAGKCLRIILPLNLTLLLCFSRECA